MKRVVKFTRPGESVRLDENPSTGPFYSRLFVDDINQAADVTDWSSDYINEIFMHFYIRIMEVSSLLRDSAANRVLCESFKGEWSSAVAAANHKGRRVAFFSQFLYFISGAALYFLSFFLVALSALILPGVVLFTRRRSFLEVSPEFAVVRSPASYDKMRFLIDSGGVAFYYDDLLQRKPSAASIYSLGGASERIFSLFIIPLLTLRDYFKVMNDARRLVGWCYTGFVLYYFSKRMAHKCSFEYYFNLLIKRSKPETYYTGNKEDRFAILEKRLCRKYAVRSVCVPHGIEYAFRTPAGLVGDVFYCTTEHARQHLSGLYPDAQAFIFDECIAQRMFSRCKARSPATEIVFFPESRGIDVNLSILKHLLGLGYRISVKLHPKDNLENYREYADQVAFLHDFDAAISNKICLARKSTVLVEAIYNNSVPIAILADPRDRGYVEHMLPSLVDDQIIRVYSFEELAGVLDGLHIPLY